MGVAPVEVRAFEPANQEVGEVIDSGPYNGLLKTVTFQTDLGQPGTGGSYNTSCLCIISGIDQETLAKCPSASSSGSPISYVTQQNQLETSIASGKVCVPSGEVLKENVISGSSSDPGSGHFCFESSSPNKYLGWYAVAVKNLKAGGSSCPTVTGTGSGTGTGNGGGTGTGTTNPDLPELTCTVEADNNGNLGKCCTLTAGCPAEAYSTLAECTSDGNFNCEELMTECFVGSNKGFKIGGINFDGCQGTEVINKGVYLAQTQGGLCRNGAFMPEGVVIGLRPYDILATQCGTHYTSLLIMPSYNQNHFNDGAMKNFKANTMAVDGVTAYNPMEKWRIYPKSAADSDVGCDLSYGGAASNGNLAGCNVGAAYPTSVVIKADGVVIKELRFYDTRNLYGIGGGSTVWTKNKTTAETQYHDRIVNGTVDDYLTATQTYGEVYSFDGGEPFTFEAGKTYDFTIKCQ